MADRLQIDPAAHAVAGGIGGALSMVVTYPLVTLSTLAQTKTDKSIQTETEDVEEKTSEGNDKDTKRKNVSTLDAAKYILKNEGLAGFYPGLESAIFGIALNNLVYYYFYELVTKIILKRKKSISKTLSSIESIIIGAIAGSITVFFTNPVWVANTRLTVTGDKKQSTVGALLDIIKQDGIKTLFAGVFPALILVVNPIIQYTIFEQVKNAINKRKANRVTSKHAFFIGALGKLIATGSTYPYITLKSRMYLKNEDGQNPKTALGWIREIYKKEGIQGFYNGISVKLSQSVLTAAFLFYFKDELTRVSVELLKLAKSSKKLRTGR